MINQKIIMFEKRKCTGSSLHMDYFEILEKYKFLKKSDIPKIPDVPKDALEHAVMSWMWNKFNEDWSNWYEVIISLPKPCQNVFSIRTVTDEINNGGLNQLFYNSSRIFAKMSIEGFSALESQKLSDVMAKAVEVFWSNEQVLKAYNDGTLESFFASYEEKLFDELDDIFFKERDSINLSQYILLHADCFGD